MHSRDYHRSVKWLDKGRGSENPIKNESKVKCGGYQNWNEEDFKYRLRVTRENFELNLASVGPYISKIPTNFVPHPIENHRQVALTIYRLAHGCSLSTLSDLFGVSHALAVETYNHAVRELSLRLYKRYVCTPRTDDECEEKLRGFIENYGFPCVGAWDRFHVYVSTHLKNYFSFKKRYSVSNMGLVSYNKRFLDVTVGAPGSTHDSRFLKYTNVFKKYIGWRSVTK